MGAAEKAIVGNLPEIPAGVRLILNEWVRSKESLFHNTGGRRMRKDLYAISRGRLAKTALRQKVKGNVK